MFTVAEVQEDERHNTTAQLDVTFARSAEYARLLCKQCPSIRCAMLGREITAEVYTKLEAQLQAWRIVDLSGADCRRLTNAGIDELIRMPGLSDTVEAIFTDPSNDKVTENGLLRLRAQCGDQCKCVLLGREIGLELSLIHI